MSNLFSKVNIDSDEEWGDVPEWEGMYQVSTKGRVRSVDRTVAKSDGSTILVRGKLLTPTASGSPYLSITFYRNNKEHNKTVHKLVAQTFIHNPKNLPEVDHLDNNPKNNCVENLRWVSAKENTAHRIASRSSCKAKRVYCIDSGETFSSLAAAGRSVQAGTQQVIDSITSQSCCKGKVFVYADNMPEDLKEYAAKAHAKYENFHPTPKMPTSRKVIAVETGMIFNSMAEASYYFKCDVATIRNRVRANKQFDGVTLKFISED